MEEVGTLPERAPVGHGPRGLQPRRQRLGLLLPRPVALARLPLGRGRPRRHLRRQAAPVLRARAVERARPDPQGAAVRADQQRGQSRRGRQGVLLLRRQHADALVHEVPVQVSAAGVSVSRIWSRPTRTRSREEFEYELLDTGVFDDDRYFDVFVEYAKAGPEDILVRITVHNRGPEAARLRVLPTLWFRNTWSWGDDEPEAVAARRPAPGAIEASHHELGDVLAGVRRGAGAAVHREREQRRSGSGASRIHRRT